jgi:hypothetical protein
MREHDTSKGKTITIDEFTAMFGPGTTPVNNA